MRRRRLQFSVRRMIVVVAVAGVVLAFVKHLFIDNRPFDILKAVLGRLDGHYTVYADGYSEYKFRSIRAGMTVREVEETMGPPLDKGQWQVHTGVGPNRPGAGPFDDIWYYTRGGKDVKQGTATGRTHHNSEPGRDRSWRNDFLFAVFQYLVAILQQFSEHLSTIIP